MSTRILVACVALAFSGLLLAGCSKEPVDAVTAAETALNQAKAAEASVYAPQSLAAAEDARVQLDAELTAQKSKLAPFRSYGKAAELAVNTQNLAERTAEEARLAKERARNEAGELIAQVRTTLEEVKTLLASAPRGKGSEADLKMLEADLSAAEASLGEVDRAFQSEQYLAARAKSQAVLTSIGNIRAAVTNAIEMQSKAKARKS